MITSDVFTDAKRVPFDRVLDRLGIAHRNKTFLCPFHEDHRPSAGFYIKPSGWKFKCFACGQTGSAIDLVAHIYSMTPLEAARLICEWSGSYIPRQEPSRYQPIEGLKIRGRD